MGTEMLSPSAGEVQEISAVCLVTQKTMLHIFTFILLFKIVREVKKVYSCSYVKIVMLYQYCLVLYARCTVSITYWCGAWHVSQHAECGMWRR
jgi:hypothetical protein